MKWINYIIVVFLLGAGSTIFISCQRTTKTTKEERSDQKIEYTCPMHPQIVRDKPGQCPICGMDLVKKETKADKVNDITLNTLLQPTNEYVVSQIPITLIQYRSEPMEIEALGYTTYNTSTIGIVSARFSGRIERLYVKYRYQLIAKGQKIADIYSAELLTAQENLLFLLRNDAANTTLIQAAKQKLLLLGMSEQQLADVIRNRKASFSVGLFSNYGGHIHEANIQEMQQTPPPGEMDLNSLSSTKELTLKEGMYVQKGQPIFSVYNPQSLWGILNVDQEDQPYIKIGDKVRITPEADPQNDFRAEVSYLEPTFREGSKTATVRVTITNFNHRLPVGSQIRATIFTRPHTGWWLPKTSVLSLGINKVVFVKEGNGFAARKIITGHTHPNWIQVIEGVDRNDSIAMNAQYLVDSESFIKTNND